MLESPSRYWKISIIDKQRDIGKAFDFFTTQFSDLAYKSILSSEETKKIQTVLWRIFYHGGDVYQSAVAGLCLRCYVSQKIFTSCQQIAKSYTCNAEKRFTYLDLLPYVLHDDGRLDIVLDQTKEAQLNLNKDSTFQPLTKGAELFSVEILRKFNPTLNSSQSLDNWTWMLIKQNKNITLFLFNLGIRTPSDWALLCNIEITRSLAKCLETEDQKIVELFHNIYRRDRLYFGKIGRYEEPEPHQLQEILQQENIRLNSTKELIRRLKNIAEVLRQDILSRKTGSPKTISIEIINCENNYIYRKDLPYYNDPQPEELEIEELMDDCLKLLRQALYEAIGEVISRRIDELKKSKGYKDFAQHFLEGLRVLYKENKSLGDISNSWGIPRITATRIFKLENLLENIQYCTENIFLHKISQTHPKYGIKIISSDINYLKNVTEEIKNFLYEKFFHEARTEIGSKKLNKNSLFAQMIRIYIKNQEEAL